MPVPAGLLVHSVARIRPTTPTDAHGNAVPTYTVPPANSLAFAAWLQQDDRTEPRTDGREPLIQRWLMISNETDVRGGDRIVWATGGLTFEVDGPPEPAYTPASTAPHHLEATLRIVDG